MSQPNSSTDYQQHWRSGRCTGASWRPLELVAMILGFVLFWPIGLAILGFKLWQMKSGHQGDLTSFAQEKADWARSTARNWQAGQQSWGMQSGPTSSGRAWNARSSGNAAFDDWRAGELARLEEERRKLEDAEREFTEHIDELRRARDREEFERFMNARRNGKPPVSS